MLLSLFPISPFFFLLGLVGIDCCYLHPKIPESYKNWQEREWRGGLQNIGPQGMGIIRIRY